MTYPRYYHRKFAWIPTRLSSGAVIWLNSYYIRPDHLGQGVVLSRMEMLNEQAQELHLPRTCKLRADCVYHRAVVPAHLDLPQVRPLLIV